MKIKLIEIPLLAFYQIDENGHRQELPINDEGYVFHDSAIDYGEDDVGSLRRLSIYKIRKR